MKTSDYPIRPRRRFRIAVAALSTAIVAAIALYYTATEFMLGHSDQQSVARVPASAGPGAGLSDGATFSFFDQPRAVPELRFTDGEGRAVSLADFRTKPVLLNVWATWCVPCRKEMASLDRLQREIGASEIVVLPLSIDRQGVPVVKKFYEALRLESLGIYVDQSGKAASDLGAVGVPTTLLIDRDGREIGRKVGPAEWDSPEVVALIRAHLGPVAGGAKAER